jgi:hypothetical protein
MEFLTVVGAIAITGFLVWVTLGNVAVYAWSDYGFWDTTRWNWKDLWHWWVINIIVAVFWWFTVGANLTIVLG